MEYASHPNMNNIKVASESLFPFQVSISSANTTLHVGHGQIYASLNSINIKFNNLFPIFIFTHSTYSKSHISMIQKGFLCKKIYFNKIELN